MSKRSYGMSRVKWYAALIVAVMMLGLVTSPMANAQDEEAACFNAMSAPHEDAEVVADATPEPEATSEAADEATAAVIEEAVTAIGGCNADFEVDNEMVWTDGRVSADVQYMVTDWQLASERWILAQDESGEWVFDGYAYNDPNVDVDMAVVGVNLTGAIEPNRADALQSPAIVFHVINATEDHASLYVLVNTPDGIVIAGMITNLEAGGEADLTLLDAPAVTFMLVQNVVPFTVTAPAA